MNNIIKLIKDHGRVPIIVSVAISISFYFLYLKDEDEQATKGNVIKTLLLAIFICSLGIYYNCSKIPSCSLLKNYYKTSITEPIDISIET